MRSLFSFDAWKILVELNFSFESDILDCLFAILILKRINLIQKKDLQYSKVFFPF